MTEPQNPGTERQPTSPAPDPTPPSATPPTDETPTQAWPSLATPPAPPQTPSPSMPVASQATPEPWEPATGLPANRVDRVGETGPSDAPTEPHSRGRGRGLRWAVAIAGVLVVAALSIAVVSLVGARPVTSVPMGWMPPATMQYTEIRLDLPGDQREKVAAFMKPFPGFADTSSFDQKLNETFDKIVRAVTDGRQTWTTDIAPWFGGQVAAGMAVPDAAALRGQLPGVSSPSVVVVTIRDRAKAIAWVRGMLDAASVNQDTYAGADLLIPADAGGRAAIAINDQVLIAGPTASVKLALDTGGKSTFVEDDSIKAALAQVRSDYAMLTVYNLKGLVDTYVGLFESARPGALASSQIDETIRPLLPAWQLVTARFENGALVASSVLPSVQIGHDATNRVDELIGHVPAKSVVFVSVHDAGDTLKALVAKFRPLPEAADFFRQFDQVTSLVGGFDSIVGWWGDAAFVVSPLDDGTVGGGLVVKNRDAAAANRLVSTLNGFVQLGGATAGISSRTVDHNGTQITVVATGNATGMNLPPGYKNEFAWASNADITVVGYGQSFVEAVLDANGASSLAGDARFKALLDRVGSENIGISFIDIGAIRKLVEPFAQASLPAEQWNYYAKEIQPYLVPFDAQISAQRKDGSLDRGTGQLIVH